MASVSDGSAHLSDADGRDGVGRDDGDASMHTATTTTTTTTTMKSPTTSVAALLADTSAAPPPVTATATATARPPRNVSFAPTDTEDLQQQQQLRQRQRRAAEADAAAPSCNDDAQRPLLDKDPGTSTERHTTAGSSAGARPRSRTSFLSPDPSTGERPTFQQTLADLRGFLLPFLKLLPFQGLQAYIKKFIGPWVRFIVRVVAKILHRWNFGLASNIAYDIHLLLWKWVVNLFFREIRPRGAWRIPKEGPILFVAGPHANQFLDPLLLMSEVRLNAGRRISFLMAEKSYHLSFIGLAGKIAHSIPVARAADGAKAGKGRIYIPASGSTSSPTSPSEANASADADAAIIKGVGTHFTSQVVRKGQLQLGKSYGFETVEVVQIIDDETIRVKKQFEGKCERDLRKEGDKIDKGDSEGAGLAYKCLPYIDQTKMYSSVYTKLSQGGCIGIFPEGGSHDRTDFLPLKHGLAIMALGAMVANPELRVQIVPVGLNYFHPHRFRSRAVIEFGSPISIPLETVATFAKGGAEKRDAVSQVMDLVFDGLKSVTVRAPDYETLMVIQASRRLYKPPGQSLNLSQVVELNKRFIMGYNAYRDEPRVQALYKEVQKYNTNLRRLGLKDHQIEGAGRPHWKSFLILLWRTGLISAWTIMALPGIVLNAPIFVTASSISRKKAKAAVAASTVKLEGKDVLATWKVLVSLGMAPILYAFYTLIAMYCVFRYNLGRKYLFLTPLFMVVAVPSFGYSALRFGEVGMDIYKSLPPIFMSLFPSHQKQLERLRAQRREITEELTSTIEEFAPKLWADFESHRIIPSSAASGEQSGAVTPTTPGGSRLPGFGGGRRRKSSYGPESSFIRHPFSALDAALFGWSSATRSNSPTSRRRRTLSGGAEATGDTTPTGSEPITPGHRSESENDPADYDEVVRAVDERLSQVEAAGNPPSKRLQRRNSGKGRSQLNLTELVPSDGVSVAVARGGQDAGADAEK